MPFKIQNQTSCYDREAFVGRDGGKDTHLVALYSVLTAFLQSPVWCDTMQSPCVVPSERGPEPRLTAWRLTIIHMGFAVGLRISQVLVENEPRERLLNSMTAFLLFLPSLPHGNCLEIMGRIYLN